MAKSKKHRTVRGDVPCIVCQYNLRLLPKKGNCPECGSSVKQSVVAHAQSVAELARWNSLRWRIIIKQLVLCTIVLYSPGIILLLPGMFGPSFIGLLLASCTPLMFPTLLLMLSGGVPEVVLSVVAPILSLLCLFLATGYMIRLERRSKSTWPILLLLFCMSLANVFLIYGWIVALRHT